MVLVHLGQTVFPRSLSLARLMMNESKELTTWLKQKFKQLSSRLLIWCTKFKRFKQRITLQLTRFLQVGLQLSSSRVTLCQSFFFAALSAAKCIDAQHFRSLLLLLYQETQKDGQRLAVKLPFFFRNVFSALSSILIEVFFSFQKQLRPTSQLPPEA